jgi:VWFA-related protein
MASPGVLLETVYVYHIVKNFTQSAPPPFAPPDQSPRVRRNRSGTQRYTSRLGDRMVERRLSHVHRGTIAAVLGATLLTAALLGAPAQQRGDARERHVYATVTGENDQPIRNLTAADFIVRENGVAREILNVTPAPPPTHIGLLVDDSAIMEPALAEIRRGLTAFVHSVMTAEPKPQIAITSFGERPTRLAPYSAALETLERAIGRVFPRSNTGAYLLEAIMEETAELRKRKAERPLIVALVNEDGVEFSNLTADRVRQALQATNASLWTLTLQTQSPSLSTAARERAKVLTEVAGASGGVHNLILTRQAIESGLTRMANLIGSRYDIAYARSDALIPPDSLRIEVKRPNARVWAPTWTGK